MRHHLITGGLNGSPAGRVCSSVCVETGALAAAAGGLLCIYLLDYVFIHYGEGGFAPVGPRLLTFLSNHIAKVSLKRTYRMGVYIFV